MATETVTATIAAPRAAQVRIHLQARSQDEDIQLPETGPILVSTDFRRYQLSTLVNRLLDTERPIPLEFLINGQFLRSSLDEFLTQNGISAETTLNVEYVKALVPPLYAASFEHDEWVSCVDVLSPSSKVAKWTGDLGSANFNSRIVSGSYDSAIRVWNLSSEVVATGNGHMAAVKAIKFVSPNQIVSSSIDRTIRLWKFEDSETERGNLTSKLELYGHTASIDNLAVHTPSSRILSASADSTIGIWSTKKNEGPPAPENLLASANKRRKLSGKGPAPLRGPLGKMTGHTAQVSDVCFDEKDSTVAYSSSWDHSVKTWDLTTSRCVDTRITSQSLFSILHLPTQGLIAVGTSARHITLIDPRASATHISALTLRGHTNAVVSLSSAPASMAAHQIVSGSHDGTCRVWDLRSAHQDAEARVGEAVYVINRESARENSKVTMSGDGVKVFGVQWDAEIGIVSAGEDKKVQINRSSP